MISSNSFKSGYESFLKKCLTSLLFNNFSKRFLAPDSKNDFSPQMINILLNFSFLKKISKSFFEEKLMSNSICCLNN